MLGNTSFFFAGTSQKDDIYDTRDESEEGCGVCCDKRDAHSAQTESMAQGAVVNTIGMPQREQRVVVFSTANARVDIEESAGDDAILRSGAVAGAAAAAAAAASDCGVNLRGVVIIDGVSHTDRGVTMVDEAHRRTGATNSNARECPNNEHGETDDNNDAESSSQTGVAGSDMGLATDGLACIDADEGVNTEVLVATAAVAAADNVEEVADTAVDENTTGHSVGRPLGKEGVVGTNAESLNEFNKRAAATASTGS